MQASTITEKFGTISDQEANILIEKYLDIVEDLQDYLAIKKHKTSKIQYLNEKQTDDLFSSLMK